MEKPESLSFLPKASFCWKMSATLGAPYTNCVFNGTEPLSPPSLPHPKPDHHPRPRPWQPGLMALVRTSVQDGGDLSRVSVLAELGLEEPPAPLSSHAVPPQPLPASLRQNLLLNLKITFP